MTDDKITALPHVIRKTGDGDESILKVVHSHQCSHSRFEVDAKMQEVECAECHEKLNPMWVLTQLAHHESRLMEKTNNLRAIIKQLSTKLRYKCRSCGSMNDMARITKLKGEGFD